MPLSAVAFSTDRDEVTGTSLLENAITTQDDKLQGTRNTEGIAFIGLTVYVKLPKLHQKVNLRDCEIKTILHAPSLISIQIIVEYYN